MKGKRIERMWQNVLQFHAFVSCSIISICISFINGWWSWDLFIPVFGTSSWLITCSISVREKFGCRCRSAHYGSRANAYQGTWRGMIFFLWLTAFCQRTLIFAVRSLNFFCFFCRHTLFLVIRNVAFWRRTCTIVVKCWFIRGTLQVQWSMTGYFRLGNIWLRVS